jgi:DNA-binding MarR family transcriptional regulator
MTEKAAMPVEGDFVDHLVEEWKSQLPHIDWTPSAIIVRMRRATLVFDRARDQIGAPYGLGGGEVMVLDALRRAGPPHCLNPRRLLEELLTPSGTMTSWIDRLAERGFVRRIRDPHDRRGILVQLAPPGRRFVDESSKRVQAQWNGMPDHAALAEMSRDDLNTLSDLLRKLTLALEKSSEETSQRESQPSKARGPRSARVINLRRWEV